MTFSNDRNNGDPATSTIQTDGSQRTKLMYTKYPDGIAKDVTNMDPLPVNGDSVYCKDIWEEESNIYNFSGNVCDLFDNLHSIITDETTDNPKMLLIHFNRTVVSNAIGLGAFSGNFSNTKIEIGNSGGVFTTLVDESGSSTKYTSRTFQLPITAGFNAIRFSFHTADTVTLSNCVVLKSVGTVARLQAAKPDNTIVDIHATTGGNLKISVEEFDEAVTYPMAGKSDNLDGEAGLITASAIYARISDTLLKPLISDAITQAMLAINYEHHEIHEGNHYNYCDYQLGVGLGGIINIVITTPNTANWGHVTFMFSSSTGATMQLYEGTSGITGGTSITPRNNNRNSLNASALSIILNPSAIISDGTRAAGFLAGGARTSGFNSREKENILKQDTTYLIRITSLAASNDISWCGEWYEHTSLN